MKIAVFTVGTPDLTVETLPGQLKHYGYNGVEWRVAERPAAAPQPLPDRSQWYWTYNQATLNLAAIEAEAQHAKELCDGVGLEIVCLSTYLTPDKLDEIERVMRAAQAIHCPKMRVMAPGYRGDTSYVQLFDATQRYLADAAALAEKHKIKLILEIHHRNIIPSASAAYRLVSPFPAESVGVIYDPGNMVHEGFEQYRLGVELLGEYLDHVHIKDARPPIQS